MKEQDLLHHTPLTELMLYSVVACILAIRYATTLDGTAWFVVVLLLGIVLAARLFTTLGVRLIRDRGTMTQATYWISFSGNLIAGIGLGGLPALLYFLGVEGVSQDFLFALVNAGIAMLVFAASGLMPSSYLAYASPAFGMPLLLSVYTGQPLVAGVWGLLLLTSVMVANATQRIYALVERYRKASKGNFELYEKLMSSRDEALEAKQKVEQVNKAIKAEIRVRELAEERIVASEQELNRILADMIDTYFRVNNDGILCRISPSVQYMLGRQPDSLLGEHFSMLFGDVSEFEQLQQRLAEGEPYGIAKNVEVRLIHALGDEIWASLNVHSYMDASGHVAGFEGVARDVTEGKVAAEALFQEKERLHVTLESIGDAVITTNTAYEVEYINPVGEGITGWSCGEARGRKLEEVLRLVDEERAEAIALPLDLWVGEGVRAALPEPAVLCDREGNAKSAIELTGAPIRDSDNRVVGAVLVFHDVTKLRTLAKQLAYQATHDALTGLINRMEFDLRVSGALHSAQDKGLSHALCYIDLDRFKLVNDTSGHHAGDELLRQISTLIGKQLRQSDILARLGGDEFGVLLSGCDIEQATRIAEKVRAAVDSFRFAWEDNIFQLGVSIGVVPISEEAGSLAELLSAADSACYVAKELGRNQVHVSQPGDEVEAERHGKLQWLQRIRTALDKDQFELHFQPIVTIDETGREERHGEVLLRMIDGTGVDSTLLQPNFFIPAAERYHLMPQIDRWVIRHTFETLATNRGKAAGIDSCAINLSGQSFAEAKLYDFIIRQQEVSGVPPQKICFEIAERAVLANVEMAREGITRLREKGFRFALDDFGTGFGSFEYLKELPIDYVKLDGALIRDIAKNSVSLATVHAINHIARAVGIKVIAEYVEDEQTVDALKSASVNYAQGYWLGKPHFFSRAAAMTGQATDSNEIP